MDPSPLNYSELPATPRAAARRNRAIAAMLIIIALIAIVLFLNFGNDEYNLSPTRLQEVGGFTLPPGTTNLKSHLSSSHGYVLAAKFDMPAASMNSFVGSTNFGSPSGTTRPAGEIFNQTLGDSWWKPGLPAKSYGGTWQNSDVQGSFLIDQSNPLMYTVWLITSYN